MNVWELINREAQSPDIDAGLLEETRRLMRLVALSERHAELARATSALVAKDATWDEVSIALCGTIHGAMVALATQQADPEQFLSNYLRPHVDDQPWRFPALQDGPMPVRDRTDAQFVAPSPQPAAAEPEQTPEPALCSDCGTPDLPDPSAHHLDCQFRAVAIAAVARGHQVSDSQFRAAADTEGYDGSLFVGPQVPRGGGSGVLALQELAPGMYMAPINTEKANRESA